jgi:hypothetical protein
VVMMSADPFGRAKLAGCTTKPTLFLKHKVTPCLWLSVASRFYLAFLFEPYQRGAGRLELISPS